jgi:hypothetical protein
MLSPPATDEDDEDDGDADACEDGDVGEVGGDLGLGLPPSAPRWLLLLLLLLLLPPPPCCFLRRDFLGGPYRSSTSSLRPAGVRGRYRARQSCKMTQVGRQAGGRGGRAPTKVYSVHC